MSLLSYILFKRTLGLFSPIILFLKESSNNI